MSIITKAAPILAEDSFTDMLPVAWELLLEHDQELAAAAGEDLSFLCGRRRSTTCNSCLLDQLREKVCQNVLSSFKPKTVRMSVVIN